MDILFMSNIIPADSIALWKFRKFVLNGSASSFVELIPGNLEHHWGPLSSLGTTTTAGIVSVLCVMGMLATVIMLYLDF